MKQIAERIKKAQFLSAQEQQDFLAELRKLKIKKNNFGALLSLKRRSKNKVSRVLFELLELSKRNEKLKKIESLNESI